VEKILNRIVKARELLEAEGFKVFGPIKPICFLKDIPVFNVEDYDLVVVFVASGGTSSLIAEIASGKKLLIWAYHENNSLPSALTAREKLKAVNAWNSIIAYNKLSKVPKEILAEFSLIIILRDLKKLRLAAFVDEEKVSRFKFPSEELTKIFGIQTFFIPLSMLDETLRKVQPREAEKVLKEKIISFDFSGISQEELINPIKLYVALKKLLLDLECKALTIDCFDFLLKKGFTPCFAISLLNDEGFPAICEANFSAAPLLIILSLASGKPAWMANLARVDENGNKITLAHCTAPTRLMDPLGVVKVKSHFESGSAASLDVPLDKGEVTLANLTLKPLKLTISLGKIVNSQMGYWRLCRTQVDIKLKGNVRTLFNVSGNHQVIAYGDHSKLLLRIGEKLGIRTVYLSS
jgi:L-fucose isomerase-like protein